MNFSQPVTEAPSRSAFLAGTRPPLRPRAPEEDFLRQLQAGGEAAFARFYDLYAPAIFSLLVRMLGNEPDAASLLPAIFLQLHRDLPRFDPQRRPLFTWAIMTARERALAQMRARKPPRPRDGHREGSLLDLAFFSGLTLAEISAELRLPEATVRKGIARELHEQATTSRRLPALSPA